MAGHKLLQILFPYIYITIYYCHSKFIVIETFKKFTIFSCYKSMSEDFLTIWAPKGVSNWKQNNGPKFSSHYLKSFLRTWDHQIISLHFHLSNELVERSIQTVKCTLKKAKLENEDHYSSILLLNSQSEKNGLSPAHRLFNHPIHTNLPSVKPQPKVTLLPPKQQLNQEPRIIYQPKNLEILSE